MDIRMSGKLDLAACQALIRGSLFRKANPKKAAWLISFFVLAAEMFLIIYSVTDGITLGRLVALLLLPDVVAVLAYIWYVIPKLFFRNLGELQDSVTQWRFDETAMTWLTEDAENTAIPYTDLSRARQTDDYLFIYPSDGATYILETATVTGGALSDVTDILQNVLGKQFIRCKY